MCFGGLRMNSDEWVALSCLLFPRAHAPEWISPRPGSPPATVRDVRGEIRYYCDACDRDFGSPMTPMLCPLCGSGPGAQAVTLTHKTYTAQTFPFFVPSGERLGEP